MSLIIISCNVLTPIYHTYFPKNKVHLLLHPFLNSLEFLTLEFKLNNQQAQEAMVMKQRKELQQVQDRHGLK